MQKIFPCEMVQKVHFSEKTAFFSENICIFQIVFVFLRDKKK